MPSTSSTKYNAYKLWIIYLMVIYAFLRGTQGIAYIIGQNMITSSNENISRVTDPFWGESTGHRWIPLTKASNAKLWGFLSSALQQTAE